MVPRSRTVILEPVAQNAIDSGCDKWEDAERAWRAIEWALAHDPAVGVPLTERGNVRGLLYDGARSLGQPDVEVIYEIREEEIIVRSAVFREAKASFAGTGSNATEMLPKDNLSSDCTQRTVILATIARTSREMRTNTPRTACPKSNRPGAIGEGELLTILLDNFCDCRTVSTRATSEQEGSSPVEHQGIEYEIKRAIGRAEWVWIIHTSPSRQGKVHGTRHRAIYAAVQAIERWSHGRHDDRETSNG